MKTLRAWATPLTVGTFLIMGTTGMLMFFHVETPLNSFIHEWAGWLMLVGVAAHVTLNWRAFKTYFRRPLAKGIMGAGVLMLALSFVPVEEQDGGNPMRMVRDALQEASVEDVIALAGRTTEEGVAILAGVGLEAAPGESFGAMTGGNRKTEMQAIRVLFGG